MNQREALKAYIAKNKKKPPKGVGGEYQNKPGVGVGIIAGSEYYPKPRRRGPNPARRPRHNY